MLFDTLKPIRDLVSAPSRPQRDFEALLNRLEERLYPETIPVLASYWLKTVCARGHSCGWWNKLHNLLKKALRERPLTDPSRAALSDIQYWIVHSGVLTRERPGAEPSEWEPFRPNPRPEWLAAYTARLLNEWLSAEVARLLVDENEVNVPVLATGRALERLLVREHLSPQALELLLHPELLSPRYVYPADAEMLRDVVLFLLGRTWAPPIPVMPASVLGVLAESPLLPELGEAVRHASLVKSYGTEEIHVPIAAAQARGILEAAPMRLGSLIVTMDGRCWVSETLESGDWNWVVYKPGPRLRIDFSAEHARLEVPWPDTQRDWSGPVHLPDVFEIFGREWHASSWETDGGHTTLHLEFSRTLPILDIQPAADAGFRRSHPAGVDIAWTALGDALAMAIGEKSCEPIEQLRRCDFIPLGRALLALAESTKHHRTKPETIETQLKAIRYLESTVSAEYGLVPWRILPGPIRAAFLRGRLDPALRELLNQTFDSLPEPLCQTASSSSPSQAA